MKLKGVLVMSNIQKKTLVICMVVTLVSQAILAVNTIIVIVRDGWGAISLIEFVPFVSIAFAVVALLFTVMVKKKNEQKTKDAVKRYRGV